MPWTDEDERGFQDAHERLMSLVAVPSVSEISSRFAAGVIGFRRFLAELEAVPEVAQALKTINGGVATTVGALVTASTGPLGAIAGPAAGALTLFALNAAERAIAKGAAP